MPRLASSGARGVVKPPTKNGEFLVCELCDAGKLADGIAVSTVNKTGSAANALGEKPHLEAQAWCDLDRASLRLGPLVLVLVS
mmetsp:Transcript_21414/g.72368  ORF Transcript_21414/g.72368 Transcript_21414/m.72368 type:complete len:83 (+) Transcript_21414:282-530(+)